MRNILFIPLLFLPLTAHAYIGPGMGAGALAVIFGILAAIFLGLIAILWYPLKRLIASFKKKQVAESNDKPDPP